MIFLNLANVDQRRSEQDSAAAVVERLRGPLSQLTDVQAFPFLPPSISGISSFGGFTFEVQDEGGKPVQQLYNVTQKLVREGNSRKDLSGLFSSFTANDPQFRGQHRPREGAQLASAHPADQRCAAGLRWARPT